MDKRRLEKIEEAVNERLADLSAAERFSAFLQARGAGQQGLVDRLVASAPYQHFKMRQPAFAERAELSITILLLVGIALRSCLSRVQSWDESVNLVAETGKQGVEYAQEAYLHGLEDGLKVAEYTEERVQALVDAAKEQLAEPIEDGLTDGQVLGGMIVAAAAEKGKALRVQLAVLWGAFDAFSQEHWGLSGAEAAAAWHMTDPLQVAAVLEAIGGVEPGEAFAAERAEWASVLEDTWADGCSTMP